MYLYHEKFGLTRTNVTYIIYTQMDVKYRRRVITSQDRINIVNDFNSGMTVKDVLSKNNIARGTLYKVLKEMRAKETETGKDTAPDVTTP